MVWIVVYNVGGTGHVMTVERGAMMDAATMTDEMAGALQGQGVRPEALVCLGPYGRVKADGLPYRVGVTDGDAGAAKL